MGIDKDIAKTDFAVDRGQQDDDSKSSSATNIASRTPSFTNEKTVALDPEIGRTSNDDGPSRRIPPNDKEQPLDAKPSENLNTLNLARCTSVPTHEDEFTYPEGGLRAWLCVFGSFCSMVAAFGVMNTTGIFQSYLYEHQLKNYSLSTIAWIFSVYNSLSFFGGLLIGPIFDAKGPNLLILSGSILTVLTFLLLGICTEYWHFLVVLGFLGGTATSLLFTPAVSAVGHFFYKKRGTATGISATGGAVGGIVFPIMLQALFPRIGFAWTTRILAFILIGVCTCATLLVRSRLPPSKNATVLPDFRIFKDPAFTFCTAGVFFLEWALFIPVAYITSYGLDHGLSTSLSYQLISVLEAGSCVGRLFPGWLADRIGSYNTMILTVILCVIAQFALWLPAGSSVAMLCTYAAVFGFASGSNISLTPVTVSKLCSIQHYGRYYATCYFIVAFGTLTGIPIAGQILAACNGSYWGLIVFTGVSYAAGMVSFWIAKVIRVGWDPLAIF